jgi:hypothetical protein
MTTNPLDAGLFTLTHEMHLIEEYSPICIAAGYLPENVSQLVGADCYALATKIMGAIRKEAQAHFRTVKGVFEETDYVACLRSMSPRDLYALRERINYLPLPKPGSYAAWAKAKAEQ